MDDPDADQILTIEELRALRDQTGGCAAAPSAAAQIRVPHQPAAVPREARADQWQDLRRRARHQRAGRRWAGPLAAAGCLALASGGVAALVMTGQSRSELPSPVEASVPPIFLPSVSASAPMSVTSIPEPSIVPPMPIVIAPSPPEPSPPAPSLPEPSLAVPSRSAPSRSADGTTKPRAVPVPPPRATYRPQRPPPATSTDSRPPPTVVNLDEPPRDAGANRAGTTRTEPGATCTTGCTEPTINRTPTSWSPTPPP